MQELDYRDYQDYQDFLQERGFTEEEVQQLVQCTVDQIPFPPGVVLVKLASSDIHGQGLFVTDSVSVGQLLAPARLDNKRTPAGRYTNHAVVPNCIMVPLNGDIFLIAARDLEEGEELTVNYRQALDVTKQLQCKSEVFSFPALLSKCNIDIHSQHFSNREKIEIIERVLELNYPNIAKDLPLRHIMFGGIYTREVTIPEGVALTGKIHTKDHMVVMTKGDITIMTDTGLQRIQAPYIDTCKAGMKRVGYAHSETIWATMHVTDETDLNLLEETLLVSSDLSWVDNLINKGAICQE